MYEINDHAPFSRDRACSAYSTLIEIDDDGCATMHNIWWQNLTGEVIDHQRLFLCRTELVNLANVLAVDRATAA
jgi:hypothetical protein